MKSYLNKNKYFCSEQLTFTMKTIYLALLFIVISLSGIAQTYSGTHDGRSYKLIKLSNTSYRLLAKNEDGSVSKSILTVIGTSSNKYKIAYLSGGWSTEDCSKEQKCTETVISGGDPWEWVVLRWYDTPKLAFGVLNYVVDMVWSDGFTKDAVSLYVDTSE
jgi:hypothetical protein